ncbi:MAG: putative metal-binding motif-containing protein, partial [Planctomycetes bacterium]|nr:putative metal-binding motif-containing protein [Planctomycetota bacterium]
MAPEGDDCNDENPEIHPDSTEVCNGIDDDCDTQVDDEDDSLDTTSGDTFYPDADQDSYGDYLPTNA